MTEEVPKDNISKGDQHIRWSARRRAMWIAFINVVVISVFHYTVAVTGTTQQISALKDFSNITITIIFGCFSIIGVYIGFKAMSKGGA